MLITGISGTGKTFRAKHITRNVTRLIVLDVLGEWGESCCICESWDQVFEEMAKPQYRIAIQIEEDPQDMAEMVARLARTVEGNGSVTVFEELSLIFTYNRKPGPYMQALVRFGRRENASVVFISQRVYDCPIDIRSQLTDVICFKSHEPRDVEQLAKVVGRDEAHKILDLKGHNGLHWKVV